MTEDEMAGWHHRLDGREFEWTPGVDDGQGGLICSDTTERLNWTDLIISRSGTFLKKKIVCKSSLCIFATDLLSCLENIFCRIHFCLLTLWFDFPYKYFSFLGHQLCLLLLLLDFQTSLWRSPGLFLFVFGCAGSSLCSGFLYLQQVAGGRRGATPHHSAQASHCNGVSCGARALGTQAQ